MGNQDQLAGDNNSSKPDISLSASLGMPGGASGHLEASEPTMPLANTPPPAADDFSSPMHPEMRKSASPFSGNSVVMPPPVQSEKESAPPIATIPQTPPIIPPVPKPAPSPLPPSPIPQKSATPLSLTDAVTQVVETHSATDFTVPKEDPLPKAVPSVEPKQSLGSLAGKLQTAGGRNVFGEGVIHPPVQAKTIAPVKNPLMEELRKQSAENNLVRPIRTYKDDISQLIEKRKTSFVGAVAAEANRRAKTVEATEKQLSPKKKSRSWVNYALLFGALFFVIVGLGIVGYAYLTRDKGVGTVPASALPKLVFSEHQEVLDLTGMNRRSIINVLTDKRTKSNLRLGSITQYYPTVKGATGSPRLLSGAEFLKQLDITVPGTLSRALQEPMMLGLHGFNGNQYFLIFKVTDYERGFAGMLEWEKTIESDLFLPFGIPRIQKTPTFSSGSSTGVIATTSATSSATTSKPSDASTTPELVSNITTDDLIARSFVDIVVKNINARALKRDDGTIVFLYAFSDKNTVVIASTESTLVEIISRLQSIRI